MMTFVTPKLGSYSEPRFVGVAVHRRSALDNKRRVEVKVCSKEVDAKKFIDQTELDAKGLHFCFVGQVINGAKSAVCVPIEQVATVNGGFVPDHVFIYDCAMECINNALSGVSSLTID